MKLVSISIEKLFGQFDYNIEFNQEEGITILTGPNGSGKTTILNIIWSLFTYGDLSYIPGGPIPLSNVSVSLFDGRVLKFPENKNDIKDLIRVYFIKDQRLTYSTVVKRDGTFKRDGRIERNGVAVLNKIDLFSKNLVEHISKIESEENKLALDLANNFPDRLLQCDQPLRRNVFDERFKKLSTKQQHLQSYGITPGVFTRSEYEGENRRVLSVYLEDYERKTSLYDDLLSRIDLFVSIMNSKALVNKTFMINAKDGFCFTSIDNKPLQLSDLSSGEQHQTILLYELLFNAPPDSLVLIDEPETSMHVSWQIEFLQDIEKIAKLSGLSFVIATHSPDLINDKIDLCVDLFENAQGKKQLGEFDGYDSSGGPRVFPADRPPGHGLSASLGTNQRQVYMGRSFDRDYKKNTTIWYESERRSCHGYYQIDGKGWEKDTQGSNPGGTARCKGSAEAPGGLRSRVPPSSPPAPPATATGTPPKRSLKARPQSVHPTHSQPRHLRQRPI